MKLACALAVLVTLAACQTPTATEKAQYQEIEMYGLADQGTKSPAAAGILNILPGAGDIYTGSWGAFVLDLLLWPPSVVWAVPQGIVTAGNINTSRTAAYYNAGPGRRELEQARVRSGDTD